MAIRLRIVHDVVICAAHALRHQNTEIDEGVANALRRCASDVLDDEIKKLAAMARTVEA
jgi:hypothetical protein